MEGLGQLGGQHQVDRGIAAIHGALSELSEASLLGLDQQTVGDSLVALVQLESRLAELKHRVLAHATQVRLAQSGGATSTATWLAHATRTTVRAARRSAHLAEALTTYTTLRHAMADGAVNLEQAQTITRALEALPADLPTALKQQAEQRLVDLAATHDAHDLRVLGDRILTILAPEVGEAHEAEQLAAAERAAERATTLSMTPDGAGTVHGRFTLPELHAGMLRKMLMALALHDRPQTTPDTHTGDPANAADTADTGTADSACPAPARSRLASHQQLGRAFCELLERLDGSHAPLVAGTGATVVVTMTLQALRGGLAAATIDTGDRITAHTARRLACEAGIVPVVLDGTGQVLDQGRAQRLFTRAQHLALSVRDQGCTALGCRTAAWFCHAHHDDPWSHGGRTDLARGRLLCPSHHRRIHDPAYEHRITPTNKVELIRRT